MIETHVEESEVGKGRGFRYLRGVALLPSAATLANMLCGVLAILCGGFAIRAAYAGEQHQITTPALIEFFPSYVAVGAYLVLLAMFFDALDGRLARLMRKTSEFGAQLDSIADIVSFGVAPALLFTTILLRPVEGALLTTGVQWRLGLAAALAYASCAAVRLARFNAENTRSESGQKRFSGLPTPGAAAAYVGLLLLYEDLTRAEVIVRHSWAQTVAVWTLAASSAGLGWLMVSRLDYLHVFNMYVRRRRPPTHVLVLLVGFFTIVMLYPAALVLCCALLYVFSGFFLNLSRRWSRAPHEASDAS